MTGIAFAGRIGFKLRLVVLMSSVHVEVWLDSSGQSDSEIGGKVGAEFEDDERILEVAFKSRKICRSIVPSDLARDALPKTVAVPEPYVKLSQVSLG